MGGIRNRSTCFCLFVLFLLCGLHTYGDIVILKDGSIRCEVLEETESPETGLRYVKIRMQNSLVWIPRRDIVRFERTSDSDISGSASSKALLDRLIQQGRIVPDLKKQLNFVESKPPVRSEVPIRAESIMGWVYLYEDEAAIEERRRAQLEVGDSVPKDFILVVSPNSRATLSIGDIGEIGLEGRTRIRFDDLLMDRSTQKYTVTFRLLNGNAWIRINSSGNSETNWKRVILTIDTVKCVIRAGILYAETGEKLGEVDISYLEGKMGLFFSRGTDGPYPVEVGETLKVSPGSNTIPVEPSKRIQRRLEKINTWEQWEPEPLAVDMEVSVPPLRTFPSFRPLPALHAYDIQIDASMLMPPETRSMGEIMQIYRKALDKYKYDTGKYPANDHGLEALEKPFNVAGWRGPYVSDKVPKRDLWGSKYVYDLYTEENKQYPDVRSMGANRRDDRGLGDDIR